MLRIIIDTGNDAFANAPGRELSRIIRSIANQLDHMGPLEMACGIDQRLFDINGNAVGRLELTEED